ncbi:tRNA uridine-5-carboxymethylaminomethyl(34) synthesis GTPase MnmE [Haploplasma axanthum]|uniref:tRNA modification GTPase MnmE n=1 Tax=Haploplasma axanthum TaxID=29552 RepID=A0A449BCJ9_HAPAX|nr:tRNA uridine-5-carboxymethylaminomethyl(34) synthesis GTPase MnmE [Haploplasma axanthum]VEU80060.1 tRNA modification GTPase TrmE [Haploplasma axanthum]
MINDTICAIATPFGTGGISVIRVSGPEAILKVNQTFKGRNLLSVNTHTIHYGHIISELGEIVDEVMISVMHAPKTFTAENVVEISTHGGVLVTQKVLERLLELDIRLANPGEFSERAYLNGRIDLVEAEAIMDVISAKNEQALKIANLGVAKQTSKLVYDLREKLLNIIANIEVNIDYPEYDDAVTMSEEIVEPQVKKLLKEIDHLLKHSYQTRLIREGIKTAIIGRPNVGKSSLLNTLLDEDKAIVTNIAGTTRDTIDAYVNIGGITLHLIDTAGIRETLDVVEQIGVGKSKKALEEAELVLLVIDQSEDLTKEDLELLELTKNKKRIIILNKSDLNKSKVKLADSISISTLTSDGIDKLEQEIIKTLQLEDLNNSDFNFLSNARHIQKVKEAKTSLESVLEAINNEMPVDIYAIDLTNAWNMLGDIIGVRYEDELIDQLFSKFCLGK